MQQVSILIIEFNVGCKVKIIADRYFSEYSYRFSVYDTESDGNKSNGKETGRVTK